MLNRATLKKHAGLMDRMAGKLGLDLEESALRGDLSISEIEDAVLACTGCEKVGRCEHLLASEGIQESAPDYCRNAELFAGLKA